MQNTFKLTSEQRNFIKVALSGKNVLVDACIGSGKTTSIQHLCNEIPIDKQVLYLTYNRLLKLDAQKKITNQNVCVQNYHGYAYARLRDKELTFARCDLIREFNKRSLRLPAVDVLIIDEYQDIDSQIAGMLDYIKKSYPKVQIIMVGDMKQKIYDNTSLDVKQFVEKFIGEHENLEFTICFRLSQVWANDIGKTWNKKITGVNSHCQVNYMSEDEVTAFLLTQEPKDILCLGPQSRPHSYSVMLNRLEALRPDKFNKHTVYASIREKDTDIRPNDESAIFTTYDSSKGLEKKIVVLFDWTNDYWNSRSKVPYQSYEILRNIFCVAASRGKEKIIIVQSNDQLDWQTIRTPFKPQTLAIHPYDISQIFQFAKAEAVDQCFSCLKIRSLNKARSKRTINMQRQDDMIDLSPCIGIYQEAVYFNNYDIDQQIINVCKQKKIIPEQTHSLSLFEKILYLTSIETGQQRYRTQTNKELISNEQWCYLKQRLSERLSQEEDVQRLCCIECMDEHDRPLYTAVGFADVVKNNIVYELKFTSELSRPNYLQCAAYMAALNIPTGILWNTHTNEIYEITFWNKKHFLNALTALLTENLHREYRGPLWTDEEEAKLQEEYKNKNEICLHIEDWKKRDKLYKESSERTLIERNTAINEVTNHPKNNFTGKTFAVLDTETTWNDPRSLKFGNEYADTVFSVGLVIADVKTFEIVRALYYILTPEFTENGMYAAELEMAPTSITKKCTRDECITELKSTFRQYRVCDIFAYNASFDFRHLPELTDYSWHDIMRKAAYKQFNPWLDTFPAENFYSTGLLRRGRGVEHIYALLKGDEYFSETHCAIFDALDELFIMKTLAYDIHFYPVLNEEKCSKKHVNLEQWKNGTIHKPMIVNTNFKNHYIGLTKTMNCGYDAKIIAYRGAKDVTIQFDDGCIKEHCRIDKWKIGGIAHPQKLTKKD